MIENQVQLDGTDLPINLFECEDNDVLEQDGKFFIVDEFGSKLGELKVYEPETLPKSLKTALQDVIAYNLKNGKLPSVTTEIYKYKNMFRIQFSVEELAIEIADVVTNLVEQLSTPE